MQHSCGGVPVQQVCATVCCVVPCCAVVWRRLCWWGLGRDDAGAAVIPVFLNTSHSQERLGALLALMLLLMLLLMMLLMVVRLLLVMPAAVLLV